MNKKCWVSIFLEDALSDEEIRDSIRSSYARVWRRSHREDPLFQAASAVWNRGSWGSGWKARDQGSQCHTEMPRNCR